MQSALDRPILYPFAFAAFPVLSLLAANAPEVDPADAVRALALTLAATGVILIATRTLLRSWDKGATMTSLLLLLFFSYGHLYALSRGIPAIGIDVGRHRYLLSANLAVVGLAAAYLWRHPVAFGVTRFLNLASLLAVGLSLAQMIGGYVAGWASPSNADPTDESTIPLVAPSQAPDIYYIVLDAYTRADVLQEKFAYDNRPFLDALESMGFVIADESRSNYAVTRLSIPSALNMGYLDSLGPPLNPRSKDAAWLDRAGRYSRVRRSLEEAGYKIVAFESAFGITDWVDSDLYLTRSPLSLSQARAFGRINAFETLLIQTSLGRLVLDGRTKINALLRTEIRGPHEQHRERISFVLDNLARTPELSGPKFVFVHLMSPHPPYAFTADGGVAPDPAFFTLAGEQEPVHGLTWVEGYRNQVAFLNSRLLVAIATILQESETEPIIVLQGDHGALEVSPDDRMKILNAYYLPGRASATVYDGISPVNTFRLIFSEYFGAPLGLLEDRSYFSPLEQPFLLSPMP